MSRRSSKRFAARFPRHRFRLRPLSQPLRQLRPPTSEASRSRRSSRAGRSTTCRWHRPGALNVEFSTPQATTRLRAEIDRLKEENDKLAKDLEAAKKAQPESPRADRQVEKLKQANKELAKEVDNSEKEIDDLKHKLAAKPAESPELKKVRAELADAKNALDKARNADQREVNPLKDNKTRISTATRILKTRKSRWQTGGG